MSTQGTADPTATDTNASGWPAVYISTASIPSITMAYWGPNSAHMITSRLRNTTWPRRLGECVRPGDHAAAAPRDPNLTRGKWN